MRYLLPALLLAVGLLPARAAAQEPPYLITYDHHLEEPGEWEVECSSVLAPESARGGPRFLASSLELEYGAKRRWTTELYLDGQTTEHESTLFTGARWENRFLAARKPHVVNPVLYVELEDINGADKTLREVVGFDGADDQKVPNAAASREQLHEVETKLILSSSHGRWNVAENLIAEKNLDGGPWEYGHSFGLGCTITNGDPDGDGDQEAARLALGLELYGGLGTEGAVTLHDTSHYLAPTVQVGTKHGFTAKVSPGWGLTDTSHPFLFRFAFGWEIESRHDRRSEVARERNLAGAKH